MALQAQKQGWANKVDLSRLDNVRKQSRYHFPKAERLELKLGSRVYARIKSVALLE